MLDGFTIDDIKWLLGDRKNLLSEKTKELKTIKNKETKKQCKECIKALKKQIRAYKLYILKANLGFV